MPDNSAAGIFNFSKIKIKKNDTIINITKFKWFWSAKLNVSTTEASVFAFFTMRNGIKVIIIINLIKCEVATCDRSVFSRSAKIIKGPNAPGAAENIEAFFS